MPAADTELLNLAPPNAQLAAGVNVQQVVLSPFGQFFLRRSLGDDEGILKLFEQTGFDPRHDLREVLVIGNAPANDVGLIMARGTFDVARIIQTMLATGGKAESYKGVQIVRASAADRQCLAFPDSTLALAGDTDNVQAAIDRKAAPAAVNSALISAVNAASQSQDAWYVTLAPIGQVQPETDAQAPPNPFAVLSKVVRMSGGLNFTAGVALTLKAVSATAQDAASLANAINMLPAGADLFIHDKYLATELFKSLSVTVDGTTTNVSLSIPEQQLEEMLNAGHAPGN